jgi:beta-lactamase class A
MDRRSFLWASGCMVVGVSALAAAKTIVFPMESKLRAAVIAAEKASGGRLGVAVLDVATGAAFSHRGDERFPMCSTFKLALVAAILHRADHNLENLERRIAVSEAGILGTSPFTKTRAGAEATIKELCRATIIFSDNTAANLLLPAIGGPQGLTEALRQFGDEVTRLDRNEPTMSSSTPGDPRDTTTPVAMANLVRRFLFSDLLREESRKRLETWLLGAETGLHRIRAGVPASWRVADKTGSGNYGTTNDVAVLWPPGKTPLIVASYLTQSDRPAAERDATHAAIARAIAEAI